MERASLSIDGMSCGHCVAHVRKALAAVPHVHVDDVGIGSATVHYEPGTVRPDDIAKAVSAAGYTVRSQHAAELPGA